MKQICSDLEAQYQEFDDLVAGLDEKQWRLKTPFFEWTIFDEVAHIAFFDHAALLAIEDLERFKERAKGVMKAIISGDSWRAYAEALYRSNDCERAAIAIATYQRLCSNGTRCAEGDLNWAREALSGTRDPDICPVHGILGP